MTSACAGIVGRPVDGPPRITLTMTTGISVMHANPRFSCLSENPGPEVAVSDFAPASDAPITAPIAAISSSIWMNQPPDLGNITDSSSAISEDGVIG